MSLGFPRGITKEQLGGLTFKHIRRYERMVEQGKQGHPNIRISECELLLKTWKRIALADSTLDPSCYSEREMQEIRDAYYDEFGIDEEWNENA